MKSKIALYFSLVFLVLFVYSSIIEPIFDDFFILPEIPGGIGIKTIFMLFFSLSHGWYFLGWKNTLVFFLLTASVSWACEQFGVETGLIYGQYHYTDALGQKLGHVPIIIPLAWFMMIYPSYIIANLIASRKPVGNNSTVSKVLCLAILSAIIMTTWDFVIDPYLSGPTQEAWIWEEEGDYFGIPLHNFAGWILTTFTIYFLYGIFEYKRKWIPKNVPKTFPTLLPISAYTFMLIANIIPGEPPELRIIGPILMGIPIAIALYRVKKLKNLD